jgi:hypothetical protein
MTRPAGKTEHPKYQRVRIGYVEVNARASYGFMHWGAFPESNSVIGEQANECAVFFDILLNRPVHGPPAPVIEAVTEILSDGKPPKAEEICREAIERTLLPATTTSRYVRNAITSLIMRERFNGAVGTFQHLKAANIG